MKHLSDYHDLYFQSNSCLLQDSSKNYRERCLKVYDLHAVNFYWAYFY